MSRATAQVIGLCVAVYAVQALLGVVLGEVAKIGLFALSLPVWVRPWTLLTSVYAHERLSHLFGNLVLFALLGVLLERDSRPARFHAFVLVTGVLAGLGQVWISAAVFQEQVAVLGLSGAAFACLGYVVTGNRVSGGVLEQFDAPAWAQLAVFVVLAAVVTWVTRSPQAALFGHFTGFLLGLMAGQENMLRTSAPG